MLCRVLCNFIEMCGHVTDWEIQVQKFLWNFRELWICDSLGNIGVRISLQFHGNVGMCDSLGDTGAIANAQQIKVVSPTIFE